MRDYGDPEALMTGKQIIDQAVEAMPDEKSKSDMRETLPRVEQGERDICV